VQQITAPVLSYYQQTRFCRAEFVCLVCLILLSCKDSGKQTDAKILAIYGDRSLSQSEFELYMPKGLNPQDSTAFAQVVVQNWQTAQAIDAKAHELIPDLDQRLAPELEAQRLGLIKKVFEEYMIQDRLDTAIQEVDLRAYYERHPEKFKANGTQYQFFHVLSPDKNPPQVATWMNSNDPEDLQKLSDWAKQNATEYRLDSSAVGDQELNRIAESYFGNLSKAKSNTVLTFAHKGKTEEAGMHFFKLIRVIRNEESLPLAACLPRIKTSLLQLRKRALLETLEKEIAAQKKR
jgi:hypothetical protein